MSQIWDVVIVGAGLSGLSSAHRIKKRNPQLKIIILEGKDRVGGRTVTEDLPAVNGPDQWDLGGQWVSSSQTHVMELIQELGLEVYPQYTAGKKIQHIGGPGAKIQTYSTSIPALSPLVMLDLGQLLWKINRLCSSVSVDEPSRTPNAVQLDSMTLHSYVEKHAWTQGVKQQMSVCSRVVFGLEPSQMSLLFFLLYAATAGGVMALLESSPGSAQEFRVKGGTQQLSQGLAEGLGSGSVCLSQPVTAIWQDGECVRVRTATDSFLGRVAIVTCPPHLAAKIEYQPALPVQREQLTHSMAPGHLIKFVITYKTAFWREKGFSGEIVAQASEACPFCVTFDATSPHGSPALLGFMGGLQAYSWSSREAEERREAVVSSLAMYLGPEASSYIHYREKDWATEEFSGGCPVSVMSPGLLSYHHPSLRRPYGRIHWAGTETATQWCGYMSGALQSGDRAALEVLERLCPSSLTEEELEAVHKALATPQHLQAPPQHLQAPPSSSSALVRGACLFTATVGLAAALLLARPQLCRQLIGQALQRVGLRI